MTIARKELKVEVIGQRQGWVMASKVVSQGQFVF